MINKSLVSTLLLSFFAMIIGCSSPVSPDEELITKFVLTKKIDEQIKKYNLREDQIHYRYQNAISGFSAGLTRTQIDALSQDQTPEIMEIPGEFIIIFIDPFDGEKWITEEGAEWSWKTIKKLQDKYNIEDNQIMSRYGYAIRGFAAELNDEQLYGLDNEEVVEKISPNAYLSLGI